MVVNCSRGVRVHDERSLQIFIVLVPGILSFHESSLPFEILLVWWDIMVALVGQITILDGIPLSWVMLKLPFYGQLLLCVNVTLVNELVL